MDWLIPNTVIEWRDKEFNELLIERILWVDPQKGKVITITIEDEKSLPILRTVDEYFNQVSFKEYRVIEWIDQSIIIEDDASIPDIYTEKRNHAWELIKNLVINEPDIYFPRLRGVMVKEVVDATGVHKSTLYKYLRRYWQSGKVVNALLPHYKNSGGLGKERNSSIGVKRGRPSKNSDDSTGINITDDIKQSFRIGIRLFYNSKEKAPLKRAYQKTLEKFFSKGYKNENGVKIPILPPEDELPSFGQFRYWFQKEQNLEVTIKSRYGKKNYELNHRPILGSSTFEAFGPGSRFQIDATIADIYLVSQFNREWIIGRPIIYVIIDVFSRMITGVYVGLEGPSWLGAMMALSNSTMNKVNFCSEYGIIIEPGEWPCSYLPQKLTADRGELEGTKPNNLINSLGVDVEVEPPYRADWKGIVEQQFRLLNLRTIKWIPGAVENRKRERGEKDYRQEATLTLNEFTTIIIHTILYHNNEHNMEWYDKNEFLINDNVAPIPKELWDWGIKNRTGRLKSYSEDIIKLNLMYQGTGKVTKTGIIFKGMAYSSETALREQWFTKARAKGSWSVKITYDPRTTSRIYLWLENGKKYETCYLFDREERFKDKRFEEAEELFFIDNQKAKAGRHQNLKAKIELDAKVKEIIKQASLKTKEVLSESTITNNQRTKDIRKNRGIEKELNREKEVFKLGKADSDPQMGKELPIRKEHNEINYIPPAEKTNKLKSILNSLEDDKFE